MLNLKYSHIMKTFKTRLIYSNACERAMNIWGYFFYMITFTFNRQLVLQSFAKTEEQREADKATYYKNRNAGLKGEITKLKQLIKLGNGK